MALFLNSAIFAVPYKNDVQLFHYINCELQTKLNKLPKLLAIYKNVIVSNKQSIQFKLPN